MCCCEAALMVPASFFRQRFWVPERGKGGSSASAESLFNRTTSGSLCEQDIFIAIIAGQREHENKHSSMYAFVSRCTRRFDEWRELIPL
jgi:hypothetical protein